MKNCFVMEGLLVPLFLLLMISTLYSCSNGKSEIRLNEDINRKVEELLQQMTLEEKVAQTHCYAIGYFYKDGKLDTLKFKETVKNGIGQLRDHWSTDEENSVVLNNWIQNYLTTNTRLKIPVIIHGEGLHGYVNDNATSFPQAIALASTWNLELLDSVYSIIAREARSRGVNQLLAPVLDIVRDPRWGRFSETFGEDPYLTGEIGVQIMKSFQGEEKEFLDSNHVVATLKHFPGSGTTVGGMNVAPMVTSERDFREVFLYPFKQAVVRGNAQSVMAFYGEYDGIPVHSDPHLLRELLRNQWGFNGIVVSDYFALSLLGKGYIWEFYKHQMAKDSVEAARLAINAGINVDMVNTESYHALPALVKNGKVSEQILDDIVREILTLKFKAGLFDNPYNDPARAMEISNDPVSKEVALESAKQAIVMLKNDNQVLPIATSKYKRIAVIGPNAKDIILGDYSTKNPKYYVSVLDGIKNRAGNDYDVIYSEGCKITPPAPEFAQQLKEDKILVEKAVQAALQSDIVILAVGGNVETDREGRDRSQLQMLGLQNELIEKLISTGKPVVLCLFGGKLYAIPDIYKKVDATLLCWNLGQETGNALASILFGDSNPSGKLTVSVPVSTGHLPVYYNKKASAYGRVYYYESDTAGCVYPFGYGLSYTNFKISNIKMNKSTFAKDDSIKVYVDITNVGDRDGAEVVQLYIRDVVCSVTRPMKELKDFQKVFLKKGETKTVEFNISPEKLSFYDRDMNYVVEPGEFMIMVGSSSRDQDLLTTKVLFTE